MFKRVPVLIAMFAAMLAAWSPQVAGAAQCTMAATPTGGAPVGSTITLVGSGWTPGEIIFVNLGGAQLGQFTADGSGAVSATATVPSLSLGSQTLFAFNNAATCESNTQFLVIDTPPPPPPLVCTISASPSGGSAVDATFSISGSGWASNDTVFINLGGIQLGQFSADPSGNLAASAVVPALALGDQMLFAFNSTASCETSISYAVVNVSTTTTTAPTTTASVATTQPAADDATDTGPASDSTDSGDSSSSGGSSLLIIVLAVGGMSGAVAAWWRFSHREAVKSVE